MTFADSVLHLVRVGARIDAGVDPDDTGVPQTAALTEATAAVGEPSLSIAPAAPSPVESAMQEQFDGLHPEIGGAAQDLHELEPGLADLEAAVALVSAGLATRVVLSGFTSWPGLLWRAYQLAEDAGVLVLPTVVRPGGRVDLVITRDIAPNG